MGGLGLRSPTHSVAAATEWMGHRGGWLVDRHCEGGGDRGSNGWAGRCCHRVRVGSGGCAGIASDAV